MAVARATWLGISFIFLTDIAGQYLSGSELEGCELYMLEVAVKPGGAETRNSSDNSVFSGEAVVGIQPHMWECLALRTGRIQIVWCKFYSKSRNLDTGFGH